MKIDWWHDATNDQRLKAYHDLWLDRDGWRAKAAEQAALLRSAVEWLDVIEASAPELTSLIAKIRASGLPDRATGTRNE